MEIKNAITLKVFGYPDLDKLSGYEVKILHDKLALIVEGFLKETYNLKVPPLIYVYIIPALSAGYPILVEVSTSIDWSVGWSQKPESFLFQAFAFGLREPLKESLPREHGGLLQLFDAMNGVSPTIDIFAEEESS